MENCAYLRKNPGYAPERLLMYYVMDEFGRLVIPKKPSPCGTLSLLSLFSVHPCNNSTS